ncbi:hypothetical protein B0T10DRAFT_491454 [Thelonectria olida]|uniref:Zn(2)-C6 fungal-type domain-containing protein n=1 Tax=Thelonectria olida TaxID=1576542 RepID=A0A9P8W022_9HYPO|nr:hypothetical protein B0T10DRAFT_491454 [Thelonectria olida]
MRSHSSSVPHPNQVRSACERCRRQKLRCTRPAAASASCARCTRLALNCQAGPQRRIGRPMKKDVGLLRKASGTATAADHGASIGPEVPPRLVGDVNDDALVPAAVGDDIRFLDGLLDNSTVAPGLDWYTAGTSPFGISSPGGISLPMECWPGVRELEAPPGCDQHIVAPTNQHFEALSRLNVDIHKGWDNMLRFPAQPSFKDFICLPHPTMDGYKNLQLLMKNAQEFLGVIKALHRQLGTQPMSKQTRSASPDLLALTTDASLSGSTTPSSGSSPTHDLPQLSTTHDSPTMFLVISCYVQLIRHIEMVLKIIYDSVADPTAEPVGRAPMAYADVPIIEASSQFILFCELVRHVVGQTNLVLGLPSVWTGRSAWTGLLRHERHRGMVNAELGAVDGLWTTRPARLLDLTTMSKELFIELSMLGIDAM